MAGIPDTGGEQAVRKQKILDYLTEHIGQARTSQELADAPGWR
jgi:hypothetical protein